MITTTLRRAAPLALAGLLLLTGCSGGTDETFLSTVHENSFWDDTDDAELIDIGHGICDSLDNGLTMPEVILAAMGSGGPPEAVGRVIGAAVGAYCPSYSDEL